MTAFDTTSEHFPTDTHGLPARAMSEVIELADGDTFDLHITPVAHQVGDDVVRMLAYNGSIPGPTLRVRQGTEIEVRVRNDGDHETTVHWHGLRVENRYDGVPGQTQDPIPVGGEYTAVIRFPDDGIYWYHPHVREDYGLELGLYGNVLVDAADDSWSAVDREVLVTLDDLLVDSGRIAPFRVGGPTHPAMGRFGNVMLTNGATAPRLEVDAGDVVRVFFTNTANTRIFDIAVPGTQMKLVAGDSGRVEREEWVDHVLIAPSERVVLDVLAADPGELHLEHHTPTRTYVLGTIQVAPATADPAKVTAFRTLGGNAALAAERAGLDTELRRQPDKTLIFDSEMPSMHGDGGEHDMGHGEMHMDHGDMAMGEDSDDGLEWEDLMADMNARSDDTNMIWKLVDADTGKVNDEIDWTFAADDRVKLRMINTLASDHPMHHPFHVHGAGRFLVLARDEHPEPNLMWKDTVLVKSGETVDILLEVTNPGHWMAHCHIAEHNQDGMMLTFEVTA